jgi:hypothetical protein
MSLPRSALLALGLCAAGLASLSLADEPTKVQIESTKKKAEKGQPASNINFSKALGLSFDSLNTLGARIDAARRTPDPVALASMANELAIAEKVSGKKASLTSEELWKQAEQLAEMRSISTELKALSLMAADSNARDKLTKRAADAEKSEALQRDAVKQGVRTRGINGTLRVVNKTDDVLYVFVNGFRAGQVGRFGVADFYLQDSLEGQTYLRAESLDGDEYVQTVSNPRNYYQWTISEG